nr:DUF3289 family protein [Erwinia psidii]
MDGLLFPCTIFSTQKRTDDYGAEDMRCGDLNEHQLKTHYHLPDISTRVNPYTYQNHPFHPATLSLLWLTRRRHEDHSPGMCQDVV